MDTADIVAILYHNRDKVVIETPAKNRISFQMNETSPFGKAVTFIFSDNNHLTDAATGQVYTLSVKQAFQLRAMAIAGAE